MKCKINRFYSSLYNLCNAQRLRALTIMLLFVCSITPLVSVSAQLYNTARQGIVAVVNTDIISRFDLIDRTKLIIFSSQLPNDKKTIKRISPQILQGLINDQLKLQETKRKQLLWLRSALCHRDSMSFLGFHFSAPYRGRSWALVSAETGVFLTEKYKK